jgi:hypothetical protein
MQPQEEAACLPELLEQHRRLKQEAERVGQQRARNASLAEEVSCLPELKQAAADLQQQVVQLHHVRQQIERLQVGWLLRGGLALMDVGCSVSLRSLHHSCPSCRLHTRTPPTLITTG